MGAIVRQQFTDPSSRRKEIRELWLDLEILRPDDSFDTTSKLSLRGEPHGHDHRCEPITVSPPDLNDLIMLLIDGKRTYIPSSCYLSYLVKKHLKGDEWLQVDNVNSMNSSPGSPIAILPNITNNVNIQYAILEEINDEKNMIKISHPLERDYFKGAFVQNLFNKTFRSFSKSGVKSQLSRPSAVAFMAQPSGNAIKFVISTPINPGTIKAFDVYVRNRPFENLEAHWIPDVVDVPLSKSSIVATTYNGGTEAGGDKLQPGQYYITLVSKDKLGRKDVNESECVVESISL